MSLFSGMKLASTDPDKSNKEGDSITPSSNKTVSKTNSSIRADNKNELPRTSDPSGFSFILRTDERQSTDADETGSCCASELAESKSDVESSSKTPAKTALMLEPSVDDLWHCDNLNFDLDPIKITGGLTVCTEKPPIGYDLQDLDFSMPVHRDSEIISIQEETKLSDAQSESSFSFITEEPSGCSNESLIPEESQSSNDIQRPESLGPTDKAEPDDDSHLLDSDESPSQPQDTGLRLLKQLQEPHTARLHHIKKSISDVKAQVSHLAEDCVRSSQNLVQKRRQLQALQEQQQQAIDEEDYEKAEELHAQCQPLEEETENTSVPLPCHHPTLRSLLTDLLALYDQEKTERQSMTEPYQELIAKQSEAVTDARGQCSQCESSHSRKLQESRSELDRDLGHLQLDKEHLVKRDVQLCARIDEGTASLRHTRDGLRDDRAQVQEDIKELEAKLVSLRLKETAVTEAITIKDQEIEMVKTDFSQEMTAMEAEKEEQEEKEIALRRRRERLDEEERRLAENINKVKEMEVSESRQLAELEEFLAQEELAIRDLRDITSRLVNDLWPGEDSRVVPESIDSLLKKKDAVRQKTEEVQQATCALLLSQTRVVTLRHRVSDTEGNIAALTETKQLAVSGRSFSEARRLTDEIKKLTSEGQLVQVEMEKLTQSNEETTKTVKLLREDVERLQEELSEEERREETLVKDKLLASIIDLRERLQDSSPTPLMQTIQRAQLTASVSQVRFLCLKHKLALPAEIEELSGDLAANEGGTIKLLNTDED